MSADEKLCQYLVVLLTSFQTNLFGAIPFFFAKISWLSCLSGSVVKKLAEMDWKGR